MPPTHMWREGVTTLCGFPGAYTVPVVSDQAASVTCPLCLMVLAFELEQVS